MSFTMKLYFPQNPVLNKLGQQLNNVYQETRPKGKMNEVLYEVVLTFQRDSDQRMLSHDCKAGSVPLVPTTTDVDIPAWCWALPCW